MFDPATIGAVAQGVGAALGGSAGPSEASGRLDGMFDASGWSVNFGAGSIESSRSQSGDLDRYVPYVIAGVGLLIVWRLTRKR
jgi:hypothetical protein